MHVSRCNDSWGRMAQRTGTHAEETRRLKKKRDAVEGHAAVKREGTDGVNKQEEGHGGGYAPRLKEGGNAPTQRVVGVQKTVGPRRFGVCSAAAKAEGRKTQPQAVDLWC